jgi:hypothetical protein
MDGKARFRMALVPPNLTSGAWSNSTAWPIWDVAKHTLIENLPASRGILSETLTGIYFQTEDFALFCCAL